MHTYRYPHPAVTVDIAAFRVRDAALQVLLVKRAGAPFAGDWALPGGFVEIDEDLPDAAARELEEETGLAGCVLIQCRAFGHPRRDPRERVISIAWYTLLPPEAEARPGSDASQVNWFALDSLPMLAFDHGDIVVAARESLAMDLLHTPVAALALPPAFTLDELRAVYEAVLDTDLAPRRFRAEAVRNPWLQRIGAARRRGPVFFRAQWDEDVQ